MTKKDQLQRLQQVAALMFDSKLALLKTVARARQDTEDHLVNLATAPVLLPDLDPMAMAMAVARLRYEGWADVRRAELNLILARQTAAWLDAREEARFAFGKTQALEAVRAKVTAASLPLIP